MDLLFGLVDFNKFKKQMLAFKKGVIDQKGTTDAELKEQNDIQTTAGSSVEETLEDFNKILAEPLNASWRMKLNQAEYKDGWRVTIHQKK